MRRIVIVTAVLLVVSMLFGCRQQNVSGGLETSDKAVESVVESTAGNNNRLFDLKIYSDRQEYNTEDSIKLWATLEYTGDQKEIQIWHGEPYIIFHITNGKDFDLDGLRHQLLKSTLLKKGELHRFEYVKSGGYSNDDPKAGFWKEFFEGKDLHLPEGEYTIKAYCDFSLTDTVIDSHYFQEAVTKIKVSK